MTRLGDARGGVRILPNVESIDASGIDTSFLSHSYFGSEAPLLADLKGLIVRGERAAARSRSLSRKQSAAGDYWAIKTGVPPAR